MRKKKEQPRRELIEKAFRLVQLMDLSKEEKIELVDRLKEEVNYHLPGEPIVDFLGFIGELLDKNQLGQEEKQEFEELLKKAVEYLKPIETSGDYDSCDYEDYWDRYVREPYG